MQEILIASIRTDSGVQSRTRIDQDYVRDLVELLKAGTRLPAVDVYRGVGDETWMADGFHRLLAHLDRVTSAEAIVVVAGMEGALASVIGGLTSVPVVAVPTSVGYGAGLDGVTALLAMHASCASGVTVVGIDNGFGAACAIARLFPAPAG
jgi:hypothetical protein